MNKLPTILILLIFLNACKKQVSDEHFYDRGIAVELANYRSTQISNIAYQLSFVIPGDKNDSIVSQLKLDVTLSDLSQPLILDFNEDSDHLKSLIVNGEPTEINHQNQHLIIDSDLLSKGENTIDIAFLAGELSLNRNDDFLYTLLVPDRASTLFPCFDQPDLKANYTLTLEAPSDWKVLAGSPILSSTKKENSTIHQFGKSDLMSTYLFSFVAGKFEMAESSNGFPQQMLYRETNSDKITASVAEIFDLHLEAKTYLEAYTNQPFPFQKLDFATIPIFQYGGMEHVGAIQYRESSLFLDENATDSELLSRAKLIGHETAHMWFGDLVSIKWFNDVWMKEVFAGFMAGKIVNPNFPQINHDLLFLTNHYPSAYAEDRTKGTNPIRQQLDNLKDAGSLYGSIIYDKAPIMMRQLETAMGEKAFQKGIQRYIHTYANSSANWNDLVEILDTETTLNLKQWSEVWVNQSSRPILSDEIAYDENGKISSFSISQQAEDGSDKLWPQLFDITLFYPEETKTISLSIESEKLQVEEAVGLSKPVAMLYNSNGLGYGVFPVDKNTLAHIPELKDEVMRGQSYINLYENMLLGNASPKDAFQVFQKGLREEKNEILARLIAGELNAVYWKFLNEAEKDEVLPTLEAQLWQLLLDKHPGNLKKTIFSLYTDIAYTEKGKERLFEIWNKQLTLENLNLNPDDFTGLAVTLAQFSHPNAKEILIKERTRITNPDKLARFDFLQPALSQDSSIRISFFNSFRKVANREKESWVLSACSYIFHPLNQPKNMDELSTSLELLEEIQRTGDIFFPKRWISVTAGQYSSAEAAQTVSSFLSANASYNPILKKKILQATDDLMRAQEIKKKD